MHTEQLDVGELDQQLERQMMKPKQKKKEIEAFNYNSSSGFEYFNTGLPSTVSKNTFD